MLAKTVSFWGKKGGGLRPRIVSFKGHLTLHLSVWFSPLEFVHMGSPAAVVTVHLRCQWL